MRAIKAAPPLTEQDVAYLMHLLTTRGRVREKINGILTTSDDASPLYRLLRHIEDKLRTRGIRVDSFSNGGHYV